MPYYLGLDLGTSSLKASLLEIDTKRVFVHSHPYPVLTPRLGWAEQSPEDWWQAAITATRAVLVEAQVHQASDVRAVGLSGQMHGAVFLDAALALIRPAVIWPDQRAAFEADEANTLLAQAGLIGRLGGGVPAGFMAATLLWMRRYDPETLERTAVVLLPKDELRRRLTGEIATDPSDASGTPLLDLRTWGWCLPALDVLDIPYALLPPILPSAAVAGRITASAARELGLCEGIPVACGASDQTAGAVGAGLIEPGTPL